MYSLADRDLLKLDAVSRILISEAFTFLAYEIDLRLSDSIKIHANAKDIDKTFRAIVADHLTIQSFYTNTTKELDIDKLTIDKYPLLYAGGSGAQINGV